jgi:uncharacterized membrane protein YedE/YeeE
VLRLTGASAGVLLLSSGDILGASGLVSSTVLKPEKAFNDPSVSWKLLFLSTFMATSSLLGSSFAKDERIGKDSSLAIVSTSGYLIGGFLVGFGTKLGNGCTTGHGICGMARLSRRSIISVVTFMTSALSAANIVAPGNQYFSKSTAFLRTDKAPVLHNRWVGVGVTVPFVLSSAYSLYNLYKLVKSTRKPDDSMRKRLMVQEATEVISLENIDLDEEVEEKKEEHATPQADDDQEEAIADESDIIEVETKSRRPNRRELEMIEDSVGKLVPAVFASSMFAGGLALSGMILPSKILGFLNLHLVKNGTWDPTLVSVMAGGSLVSWISYQFVKGVGLFDHGYAMECPRRSSAFAIPTNKNVDLQLIGGAISFGVGWGISGLCPGPALLLAASGTEPIIKFWWPTFFAGSYLANKVKEMY